MPPYSGNVEVRHLLWQIAEGEGYELLKQVGAQGAQGAEDRAVLRLPDPAARRSSSASRIPTARGRSSGSSRRAAARRSTIPPKIKCCGFPIIQAREETALGELIQPIEQAMEAGADAMVTPCPLCHLSLDAWQSKLKKATGKDFAMPILHLSQLVGVAAGLEESELKFKRHVVSVAAGAREARGLTSARVMSWASRAGALVGGVAGAAVGWGWFEAGWVRLRVARAWRCRGLPAALDGLRIAHLSDFHLGRPLARARARPSARSSGWRSGEPDLVCVTGDLVSHPRGEALLRQLLARLGRPLRRARQPRRRAHARPVLARRGLDDLEAGAAARRRGVDVELPRQPGPDRRRRPARVPRGHARPWELVDGAPICGSCSATSRTSLDSLPAGAFDLVLAGHMHAGQIAHPVGRGGKLHFAHPRARYAHGLYRARRAASMHVSPGLGTTFVPFRFFARPEATELVLRAASRA